MSALSLVLAAVLVTNGLDSVGTTNAVVRAKTPARITSDSTYYDRKEGLAIFKGHVHVDDSEYQMHAKKAYVFMDVASNALSRIVAMGSVALTNGTKRAYGEKMTYRRDDGLVVLHGADEKRPAVVIDDTPKGPQTVMGRKIRFWINTEQVEVVDAVLSAPQSGKGGLPFKIPGR